MERKGAAPSLWQRQTLSTKGESDGLSSSKLIISHFAFVDAQRFGKRSAYVVFAASPASHDGTNALIFKREQASGSVMGVFQNREAQSEMPQEAAAQTGGTDRPPNLGSLSQNEAGSKSPSEPGETGESIWTPRKNPMQGPDQLHPLTDELTGRDTMRLSRYRQYVLKALHNWKFGCGTNTTEYLFSSTSCNKIRLYGNSKLVFSRRSWYFIQVEQVD